MSDVNHAFLVGVVLGGVIGGLGSAFLTAIRWYRLGLRDSRDIWQNASREAAGLAITSAKEGIAEFVRQTESSAKELVDAYNEKRQASQAGGDGDAT